METPIYLTVIASVDFLELTSFYEKKKTLTQWFEEDAEVCRKISYMLSSVF
jgi:hypothetical protein